MARKIGEVINKYVELRDKKGELKKKHSKELEPLLDSMRTIEQWLKRELQTNGLSKQSSDAGATAFLKEVDSCKTTDGIAFLEFCKERDAFELLEIRPSKTTIRAFMENYGEVPPGVDFTQSIDVQVRRGK